MRLEVLKVCPDSSGRLLGVPGALLQARREKEAGHEPQRLDIAVHWRLFTHACNCSQSTFPRFHSEAVRSVAEGNGRTQSNMILAVTGACCVMPHG
jgi:hypothetical protein